MNPEDRLQNYPLHDSQRGRFAFALYKEMYMNEDVWLITGDLGYKMFDAHFEDFPERCLNAGASEQAMMGIAVGLALEGKIPFVYSITPFLLYRPFETIRNYIDHEDIPVKLIGSGRNDDYKHDGFSHDATDVENILANFKNVLEYWPKDKSEIDLMVPDIANNNKPSFLSLSR